MKISFAIGKGISTDEKNFNIIRLRYSKQTYLRILNKVSEFRHDLLFSKAHTIYSECNYKNSPK